MSFDARDLAIKLSAGDAVEALWAMACPACDSTGTPKPNCPAASKPCPAPSKPGCPKPSKKADGKSAPLPGGLALLRSQMRDALGRDG